ncbi:MAG TPA: serine protease [Frankiaceae bacterium]|nr:serine protease [Frankiaceae bacterium]
MRFPNRFVSSLVGITAALAIAVPTTPSNAIVGGTNASAGEYPWMAAVYFGSPSGQFCGGTLVRPTIVITAAHCILGVPAPVISGVLVGRTTLNGTGGDMVPAAGFVIHPAWNAGLNTFDIAAIRLTRPAVGATPLPWATPSDAAWFGAGDTATVIGWGATSEGGSGSNSLKEATVPIVSDAGCTASYGVQYVAYSHLCAGYPQGGTDTCQGDSGGPLMVRNGSGQFILAGITSFGVGCARAGYPGVYTRVANMTSFIDAMVLAA